MSIAGPTTRRYAVYYTPAQDHPLTRAAEAWLGRSAFASARRNVRGIRDPQQAALTAEPRRYGFHATIKAPFRLHAALSPEDLEEALSKFCVARAPCRIGPMHVAQIGSFFALVPASPPPALQALSADLVSALDRFRAAMSETEHRRRTQAPLSDAETANLARWGYPYVFDQFRFHMTLTGAIDPDQRAAVQQQLQATFQPLTGEDFVLDTLSLFVQARAGSDFMVRARFPIGIQPAAQVAG